MYTLSDNQPFGTIVTAALADTDIRSLPATELEQLLFRHHLLVFRGFKALSDEEYTGFCSQFGPLLEWDFGVLLNVRMEAKPANHIFSSGRVELHWDGAFAKHTPRINVFQCVESSSEADCGGETTFANGRKLVSELAADKRTEWEQIRLTYQTEKKAHYGGEVACQLISRHPVTGEPVVKFIEPDNEDNMEVNPVQYRVAAKGDYYRDDKALVEDVIETLYDPAYFYKHAWRKGDFMMVDNNAILHGREKIRGNVHRHLKRIHIL